MESAGILATIASVGTAFAGFTGVVVALGLRRDASWTEIERHRIRTLLDASLGATLFSLLPMVIQSAGISESAVWRISTALFGLFLLRESVFGFSATWLLQGRGANLMVAAPLALVVFGVACSEIAIAMGTFAHLTTFVYVLGLFTLLVVSTVSFAILLMRH